MSEKIREKSLPLDCTVCNCAGCFQLLIGARSEHLRKSGWPKLPAGFVNDRPYCEQCLPAARKT